jgi:hypothetical protein
MLGDDPMSYVHDEATQMLEEQYLRAVRRAASYMARGYWRAATRWADVAWCLAESIREVGWAEGDSADV